MKLTIRKIPLPEQKTTETSPSLGFVHQAIAGGTAYGFGDNGYFVVAGDHPILPRFVVDVRLPELPNAAAFKWVAIEMLKLSSGMLFVDSAQSDAFALAWKLQIPVLPGSPLFEFAPPTQKHSTAKHSAHIATAHDHEFATKLLASVPRHLGGAIEQDIKTHSRNKHVWVMENDGKPAGAAIVVPQGDSYAWVEAFVLEPAARHIDTGHKVFEKLAVEIVGQKRRVIFGMSHQGTSEYIGAIKLGSKIVRQSYHGFLAGACRDFQYTPTYT